MDPSISGGVIDRGELAVEGLGFIFNDIYEFEEVESCTELEVDGNFEAPGTTSVGEASDSLGTSIGSVHNG